MIAFLSVVGWALLVFVPLGLLGVLGKRTRRSVATVCGVLGLDAFVMDFVSVRPNSLIRGAILWILAALLWHRPDRAPLHPPNQSTFGWLKARRR